MSDPKQDKSSESSGQDRITADNTAVQQIRESAQETGVSPEEAYQTYLQAREDSQDD